MFGQTCSVFVSYLVRHDQCLLVLHSTIFIGLLTGYIEYTVCYMHFLSLGCHSLGEVVECHLLHAGWLDRKCLG